jgi:RNA polymerase sigma factor (sigma-70 family)
VQVRAGLRATQPLAQGTSPGDGTEASASASQSHPPITLSPGQRLRFDRAGQEGCTARVDLESVSAWTQGSLQVNDWPLAELVAEMNRYSATPVRLTDPALADIRISGTFRTGQSRNPDDFRYRLDHRLFWGKFRRQPFISTGGCCRQVAGVWPAGTSAVREGAVGNERVAAEISAVLKIDGQSEAEALVGHYREPLRRFFERRLRNRADAEDLTQEVLVRLTRQRLLIRQTRPAYIFLTARSVLLDQLRRNRVRALGDQHQEDDALIEAPSAERVCVAQERVQRVSQLMERLTPRTRQVFTMQRIEGLTYTQIAHALGITMGTVEKHMTAALRFLVQHLDEIEG